MKQINYKSNIINTALDTSTTKASTVRIMEGQLTPSNDTSKTAVGAVIFLRFTINGYTPILSQL